MRVLMPLTKALVHDPRVHKEATTLTDAGHDVTVLEWARHLPDQPADEVVDGVRVVRVRNTALMERLPGALLRNPLWWRLGRRAAEELHAEEAFDVVHCHDLDTLPIGARLKRDHGTRLVFDAHEAFDVMIADDHARPVTWAARRLEARLLPHVDLVVTVNEAHVDLYEDRLARAGTASGTAGGSGGRAVDTPVILVMNCPPLPDDPPEPPGPDEAPFTLVYVGLFRRERFFPDAVEVVGGLDGVRFLVAGKREGIYDEVEEIAARFDNVEFLGPVRYDEVMPTTLRGHAVFCMTDPSTPHNRIATETKMLDAMGAARPVVISRETYSGGFADDHEVGLAVDFSREALRDAVTTLRDDPERARRMGRRARKLAETEYHWEVQARRLVEAYEDLDA